MLEKHYGEKCQFGLIIISLWDSTDYPRQRLDHIFDYYFIHFNAISDSIRKEKDEII